MKFNNYQCSDLVDLKKVFKKIDDKNSQLVKIFSPFKIEENKKIIKYFNKYLSKSTLVGITSPESIYNKKIVKSSALISVISFKKSKFKKIILKGNLLDIFNNIDSNYSKAIMILSPDRDVNGDKIISDLNKSKLDIILAGGHASSNYGKGYVFDKNGILEKNPIAIIFSGEHLKVKWKHNLGWDKISRKMEITKSKKEVIYELDGRNIFDVYKTFLGEDIGDKLKTNEILKFPLLLEKEINIARCPRRKVGNGIEFFGSVSESDEVRIAYGNLNRILKSASEIYNDIGFKPEATFIYSCLGRSRYLEFINSDIEKELKYVEGNSVGICTGGEYGFVKSKYYNFNITNTVLYLSEADFNNNCTNSKKKNNNNFETESLFHFSRKIISDLESINDRMQILNKKTNSKEFQKTAEEAFKLIFPNQKYTGAIISRDINHDLNIYVDNGINSNLFKHLKKIWKYNRKNIIQKSNVLGYKKMFIISLEAEVAAKIIILSDNIDLFEIKENKAFINQIPNYLKKAILYENFEKNIASLSTLEKTSDFLYSTLNLGSLYQRIIDIIVGTMGMEASLILIGNNSKVKVAEYKNIDLNSNLFSYIKGRHEIILEENDIIIENNLELIQQSYSFIAIPIILDDYKAVLYAFQSKYKRLIDNGQKQFIRTLANQIRVSIKNALNHRNLKKLAVTDGLTKLYNHRYFHNQIKEKKDNYSIAILDIDDFKIFNDDFGHQAGDEILRQLSDLLKKEVRDDDLVARYGGEEFIIYLNLSDDKLLKALLNRLLKKIRNKVIKFGNKEFKITVSIGAAINKDRKDAQKIIKKADTALYIAKGLGKNQIQIYQN